MRKLAMRVPAVEPRDPGPQARVVVVDEHQVPGRVAVNRIVAGHLVFRVLVEQQQPVIESPRVQQGGLGVEEVLDLLPTDRDCCGAHWAPARSAAAPIWCCQRRQKARICSSSLAIGERPMPREMSFHSTPPLAKPCWQDSNASTSSGG